jgi:hypothetical protein
VPGWQTPGLAPENGLAGRKSLTGIFNQMVRWIREMVNLKETLTKLLSTELAEQAASEGLVLGGQEIECTILFTDVAGFSTLSQFRGEGSSLLLTLSIVWSKNPGPGMTSALVFRLGGIDKNLDFCLCCEATRCHTP